MHRCLHDLTTPSGRLMRMSQASLFLLVVAIAGIYMSRWSRRLAPWGSELPLKTLTATGLSMLALVAELTTLQNPDWFLWLALVAGPVYVFAPLATTALARLGRYRIARGVAAVLYWTEEGRNAVRRLLAQTALRRGDADDALELIPNRDPLMLSQAYALTEEWENVLELDLPEGRDNAFLGEAARIQALLGLGRAEEAERELSELRRKAESGEQGPLAARSLRLSEARIAADRGDFGTVRDLLSEPVPGVPPHVLLAVVARAAARSGQVDNALQLYAQAYAVAPEALRERYADQIRAFGRDVPNVERPGAPYGTFAGVAVLVVAYLAQMWADQTFAALGTSLGSLAPSSAVAAFLLNIPDAPAADAWWRYLSYAFVHGNLIHILFNLWVFLDIGRLYEARRGWPNVVVAFVAGTAMGGYITSIAQASDAVVLVGASGGVLGIAGALLADVLRSRGRTDRVLTRSLLQWMALIALLSVAVPNVSLWGHVGGVVGGMLWGFMRQGLPRIRTIDLFAGGVALGVMGFALVEVFTVAFRTLA